MSDAPAVQLSLLGHDDVPGDRQQWATPRKLFAQLHREYRFTVDAAAVEWNKKLDRYWSPDDNGLMHDWSGELVWCNPPYDDIDPWVEIAMMAEIAVLLLPARVDRPWFHMAKDNGEVHFFLGRLSFVPPPGIKATSNEFSSIMLVLGTEATPGRVVSRSAIYGVML